MLFALPFELPSDIPDSDPRARVSIHRCKPCDKRHGHRRLPYALAGRHLHIHTYKHTWYVHPFGQNARLPASRPTMFCPRLTMYLDVDCLSEHQLVRERGAFLAVLVQKSLVRPQHVLMGTRSGPQPRPQPLPPEKSALCISTIAR